MADKIHNKWVQNIRFVIMCLIKYKRIVICQFGLW